MSLALRKNQYIWSNLWAFPEQPLDFCALPQTLHTLLKFSPEPNIVAHEVQTVFETIDVPAPYIYKELGHHLNY